MKSRMGGKCAACISGDAVQDLISRSGPYKWLGLFVVHFDKLANRRFQFFNAAECTAPNPFIGELGEPSLNLIQP